MDQRNVQTIDLLARIEKGEGSAMNQLIQLWETRVYNMAYKMLRDHDKAMDIMQKTFIKMYRSLNQLKDATKFKSWLYTIVVNYCKSDLRTMSRVEPLNHDLNQRKDLAQNPGQKFEQMELKEIILTALQQIPNEQKAIIILKEYEGFKFHEIADTLDISINTAKSRMYYGLKSMRKVLMNNPKSKEIYYELYNH